MSPKVPQSAMVSPSSPEKSSTTKQPEKRSASADLGESETKKAKADEDHLKLGAEKVSLTKSEFHSMVAGLTRATRLERLKHPSPGVLLGDVKPPRMDTNFSEEEKKLLMSLRGSI